MKLKLQNTYKHLIGFCAKGSTRPILSGVHITPEGHLEATNSHIMLRLLNRVGEGEDYTFDPRALSVLSGTYPTLERLITTKHNVTFLLNPATAASIFQMMKQLKTGSVVTLTISPGTLLVQHELLQGTFEIHEFKGDAVVLAVQSQYLARMCAFIADTVEFGREAVKVGITSPVRPIVFELEKHFVGLITPVRIGN